MKRKPVTAEELMARLEADPQWVAERDRREAERASRAAELQADESELVQSIRALGYEIDSVWDLVNNAPHPFLERRFIGPYERAYPLLIQHLRASHEPGVREGIIRSLTVRDGGATVESALLAEFESESSPELRWVLANALRIAMPYSRRRKHPEIAAVYRSSASQRGDRLT
jgi:hypothetical protein